MIKSENLVTHTNRVDILSYMPKNSICAEFGVYTARFSYWIIKNTSPQKIYLVDPYWKLYGQQYPWNKKSTWDTFSYAAKNIQKYDENRCSVFVIDTDIEFLKIIPDNYFDWIYIDSTHEYEDTLNELNAASSKIKPSGFICGHDWRENPKHIHHGVCKAIVEWLSQHKDYKFLLRDNYTQWIMQKL